MISLTEEDKEIIRRLDYPKIVDLSIGSYLVKADFDNTGINELIGYKLASILNIKCPKYYLTEVEGSSYVLSEDLNKQGTFTSAFNLKAKFDDDIENYPLRDLYQDDSWYDEEAEKILHGNSLYDIWSYLEKNYDSETSKRLTLDILKIYIFDILFLNYDRSEANWGILKHQNNEVEVIIFDNELMFNQDSEQSNTVSMNVDFLKVKPDVYEDFKCFLKESSSEFIDIFKYYFDLFTPEAFKDIIENIELENKIEMSNKDELIALYTKHREKLLNIYEQEIGKEVPHAR